MVNGICSIREKYILGRLVLALLFLHLSADIAAAKILTIGIITNVGIHQRTVEGFKQGMVDIGYTEGQNVRYIFDGILDGDVDAIDAEIEKILAQDVDMLVTMANEVSLRAKVIIGGSGIPILIAGSSRPVEEGLLDSLGRPGGDITGVRVADNYAKTLEWLLAMLPDTRKVVVPYNPADSVSIVALDGLDGKAARLGIELICNPVASVEDAVAVIENLPEDVDAIYRMPSPTLDPRNEPLSHAAITRKLPMISCLPLDDAVLMTFSADLFRAGKQTARLAQMVYNGAKPSDLPVETCDAELTINLKTAEAIGVYIPDEILLQAETIIRQ
jgi:putative ABC transport system substrate-binding protein